MSLSFRILFLFLMIAMVTKPGFSQETSPAPQTQTDETNKESSKTAGLRKLPTRSRWQDLDINVNIDEKVLEASIELAVENAMNAVEGTLERLEIHIEPIEIDLGNLNIDMDPIVINIPDLDIDVEPVDLDDMDIDIDIDQDDFDWNDDNDDDGDNDQQKRKEKRKSNDKSNDDKDKSKGLKKLN